ncbi:peptidase C14 [Bordetella genomosp. 10]|uniref:Peptidase C14 n=1 Tax=Bordetella genomosp. 10 TaxID=1416804 RepID=A0A261SLG1_9BORD|nr:caspase family protein [Bordetella genomosp. 10]OZI37995.1 peptidase C14 [Bordetella genomosp. 10]
MSARRNLLRAAGAATLAAFLRPRRAIAQAVRPTALVIGNARYGVAANALRNPAGDARLVAETLRRRGIDTTLLTDLTVEQMRESVQDFARRSQGGGIALFYFAGHAAAVDGINYLFGVDLPVPLDALTASLAQQRGLSLQNVTLALRRAGVRARLLVIDACRTALTRGPAAGGLARAVPAGGELVAYSTQPGATAEDGFGDGGPPHSPYAYYFAQALDAADGGAAVENIFKQLTADVQVATSYRQVPHYESSLVGTVRLAALEDAHTVATPRAGGAASGSAGRGAAPSLGPDLIRRRMTEWEREIEFGARYVDEPRYAALQARAKAGDVVALTTLGLIAESGTHGQANEKQAVAWYRRAVQRDFVPAKTYLGELVAMGRGAPRNYGQAERLFQEAAGAGHQRAALDLFDVRARMGQAPDPSDLASVFQQIIRDQGAALPRP